MCDCNCNCNCNCNFVMNYWRNDNHIVLSNKGGLTTFNQYEKWKKGQIMSIDDDFMIVYKHDEKQKIRIDIKKDKLDKIKDEGLLKEFIYSYFIYYDLTKLLDNPDICNTFTFRTEYNKWKSIVRRAPLSLRSLRSLFIEKKKSHIEGDAKTELIKTSEMDLDFLDEE